MDYSSYCLFYWTVTNKDESWDFSLTQICLYIKLFNNTRVFHMYIAVSECVCGGGQTL